MFYRLRFFYEEDGKSTGSAFDDAEDLDEKSSTGITQNDDGSWTATDSDGNTITVNTDGSVTFTDGSGYTIETTDGGNTWHELSTQEDRETSAPPTKDDVKEEDLPEGYSTDDIESVDEDGTVHFEDGTSTSAGAVTGTTTVETVTVPGAVVDAPEAKAFMDQLPAEQKTALAGALSKSGNKEAAQTVLISNAKTEMTKAGIDKSAISQLLSQGLGRGTSKQALEEKQQLANYINSGNYKAAADLLGMKEADLVNQLGTGKLTLDDLNEKINDKYPDGPVDPAAAAMLGLYGIGEPNEAFNKAYADNIAKGMDPGRAYDAALDAAGIAPTEWMNQATKQMAAATALIVLAPIIGGIGATEAVMDLVPEVIELAPLLQELSMGGAIVLPAFAPTTLITDSDKGSGSGSTSSSSGASTSIGSGSGSTSSSSGASTSNPIVSGTTTPSSGTTTDTATHNYNPFDVLTPDFSSYGLGAQNTIDGTGMGSGTAVTTTSEPKATEGINLNDRDDGGDSNDNDDWGGATVGNTGDDGKPKDNPNAGGSETTEGIKNDVNGNKIDFNVNTSRIGFSDDPNKANYDERDAKKWNRGMEDLSLNVVSDERCKSFISNTFSKDPLMQRWSKRVIEITQNPDGSTTKTTTIEGV